MNIQKTKIGRVYYGLNSRCTNPQNGMYYRYGERGIKNEWKSFEEFEKDMYKGYEEHLLKFGESDTQIDRIDNDGNYSKENCRWVTRKENNRNKRNNTFIELNGQKNTLSEWAEKLDIPYGKFLGLLKNRNLEYIIKNRETIRKHFGY